jgi:hypothetical protein
VDLRPWALSDAVQSGDGTNELQVDARGPRLTFTVNGVSVTDVDDPTLGSGSVGVFVGGDGNMALLERLTVEPLT